MKAFFAAIFSVWILSFLPSRGHAQGVTGGGGGGLMPVSAEEPDSLRQVLPRKAGCVEGRRAIFYERDNIQDQTIMEVRTCVNGTYYPNQRKIDYDKLRCTHGNRSVSDERKNGWIHRRYYRCEHGKRVLVREESWQAD